MSESNNPNLMDIEAGGENSQYESIHTFVDPKAKDKGQFKDSSDSTTDDLAKSEKATRGEKTAENIRYGEAISEHGFGGETTGNSGDAQQGGYGKVEEQTGADETTQSRREQGYSGGTNIGA